MYALTESRQVFKALQRQNHGGFLRYDLNQEERDKHVDRQKGTHRKALSNYFRQTQSGKKKKRKKTLFFRVVILYSVYTLCVCVCVWGGCCCFSVTHMLTTSYLRVHACLSVTFWEPICPALFVLVTLI